MRQINYNIQLSKPFNRNGLSLRASICRKAFVFALVWVTCSNACAQIATKAQEVWPSIDVYYKINPKIRLYGTVAGTKMSESSYTDGALGIFFDYFGYSFKRLTKLTRPNHPENLPKNFIWLRAGYQYSATPPSTKDPFKENMLVTEANSRFYLPWSVLMTVKNRFDWRSKNGEFNGRYRPRLILEKDLHTEFMFFTASGFAEYFVNFGNSAVNRFRIQLGVEFKVTKIFNYEVFWNHQFANQPEVAEIDAFGMTVKAYLHRKKKD
jgi:Protein of unknown function (DUF2490)